METRTVYGFDQIILYSNQHFTQIRNSLPVEILKAESYKFDIESFRTKKKSKYQSAITFSAPTDAFLDTLNQHEECFWPYCVGKVEFAKDTPYETKQEAVNAVDETLKTIRKKYSAGSIFDGFESKLLPYEKRVDKYLDVDSGRSDGEKFYYDVYARPSKTNGKPLYHFEWRILGAGLIAKRTEPSVKNYLKARIPKDEKFTYERLGRWFTEVWNNKAPESDDMNQLIGEQFASSCGIDLDLDNPLSSWEHLEAWVNTNAKGIRTISDLIMFDIRTLMDDMEDKYLRYERIDTDKLGKWLCDWTRRRKFTEDEKFEMDLSVNHFLTGNDIRSPGQLISWFKAEKKRIRSKAGRRTAWDEKILKRNASWFLVKI
jgi:hypothetical protein